MADEQNLPETPAAEVTSAPSERTADQRAKDRKVKRRWIARHRRRFLRRAGKRVFLSAVALILGMLIAFGAMFAGGMFVLGGLDVDFLQKRGLLGNDIDTVLTANGEKDLTAMSLLEVYNDFLVLRSHPENYTVQSVLDRYGVVMPENMTKLMPAALLALPLDQLSGSEAGDNVLQVLTVGDALKMLPEGMLNERAAAVLAPRSIKLITDGKYAELLAGVELGFFTGVNYDEEGNVAFVDPAVPTVQEVLAKLDLGRLMEKTTGNGDILELLATDLGEAPVGALFAGMTDGALFETLTAEKLFKDIVLLNEETGRYELSFVTLAGDFKLGALLGYTEVDGVWYSAYTDDEDPENDTQAAGLFAVIAEAKLADLLQGQLDLGALVEGLYLGDLLDGYVKGEAQYGDETDPEKVTGYEWTKDGAAVTGVMAQLAGIAVSDVLNGTINLTALMDGNTIGELMGYEQREDGWYHGEKKVVGILSHLADLTVSDLTDTDTLMATLKEITVAEALDYQYNEEDGKWHANDGHGNYTGPEPSAVLAVLMDSSVSGLSSKLDTVRLGDLMGYTTDDEGETWYKGDAKVTDITGVFASLTVAQVAESGKIQEAVNDLKLGTALGYVEEDGVWYNGAHNEVEGLIAKFVDLTVSDLTDSTKLADAIQSITVSEAMDYRFNEEDGKWHAKAADGTYTGPEPAAVLVQLMETPVSQLSDKLGAMYLGDLMGYTTEDGGETWYKGGVKITDITATFASLTMAEIKEDGKLQEVIDGLKLGTALGYTEADGVWYNAANEAVTGIIAEFADFTVSELSDPENITDAIKSITLSDAMGYQKDGDTWRAKSGGEEASAVIALLMDEGVTVGQMETRLKTLCLGDLMGYEFIGDEWYHGETKVTDLTADFADIELRNINGESIQNKIKAMTLGKALGYHKEGEDWYNGTVLVEGILVQISDLTVGELSDSERLMQELRKIKIADAMDYKKGADGKWHANDGSGNYTGAEPIAVLKLLMETEIGDLQDQLKEMRFGDIMGYTKTGDVWYKDGVAVTDITASFADLSLFEMEDSESIRSVVSGMMLGKVFGYTQQGDEWYNGEEQVDGVLAQIVGMKVEELTDAAKMTDALKNLTLANVLDYKKGTDGKWHANDGEGNYTGATPSTVLGLLMGTKIGEMETKLQSLQLGELVGYEKTGGVWYNGTEPASGIIAALADLKLNELSDSAKMTDAIKNVTIADALDYKKGADGKWHANDGAGNYTGAEPAAMLALLMDEAAGVGTMEAKLKTMTFGALMGYEKEGGVWKLDGEPITDLTANFADLQLNNVNAGSIRNIVDDLTLGRALGYEKVGDVWMNGAEPAGSLLAALADTPISGISASVETMQIGTMMGYTKVGDVWKDGADTVTGVMAALAECTLNGLSTRIANLTVADVFDDTSTGVLSLVSGTTKITELGSAFSEIFAVDSDTTIADIEAAGMISFTASQETMLADIFDDANWKTTHGFRSFVSELLDKLATYYAIAKPILG